MACDAQNLEVHGYQKLSERKVIGWLPNLPSIAQEADLQLWQFKVIVRVECYVGNFLGMHVM